MGKTLIVAVMLYGMAAVAAEGGAMTGRGAVYLDGDGWVMLTDPGNTGKQDGWGNQAGADARPARVPGIIQTTFPGYHGVAWYWRTFAAPVNPNPGGRYLLRFWAVDYLAEVWVNGTAVGGHEGGETPFTLDVTDAIKAGRDNLLAVRVLNPTGEPIDGIVLAETPHRNKGVKLTVGGMYNAGGITEPVELITVPAAYLTDMHVQSDWQSGAVRVAVTAQNHEAGALEGQIEAVITKAEASEIVASTSESISIAPGASSATIELTVPDHRLWELDDPSLYRVSVRIAVSQGSGAPAHDAMDVRFGFRDFRVVNGFFHLNGRRIFLKSSHTGNHCPVGQIIPPDNAKDLLRRDLLYAKANGFNMIRFIAGMAHPYQLDLADEIGLMVYEETLAGWLLADSPKMTERFDRSVREMVLRDRNHPSVTIWGMLNETPDSPVFRRAVADLALVRELDNSRLVLLNSGRWDGCFHIGSGSNPGSSEWEYFWGAESPKFPADAPATWGPWGGYFQGAGDAHVYPVTPHTPDIENGIRNLGRDMKPVFLSEYGIGSLMNAVRELRTYEQHGIDPELDDVKYFQATVDRLNADWSRYGMDTVYAFPEHMLLDSQRLHGRQRILGFDLIRSNPQICGYNLTGLLDHGFTGEGLWTFWREWKPGIADTLRNGWAPLRWCVFAAPMHAYAGRPVAIEVVLANESALAPGDYPATVRVFGPKGQPGCRVQWEKAVTITIPGPAADGNAPLAVPVLKEEVTLAEPGEYEVAANLDKGGAPAGGTLLFHVSAPLAGLSGAPEKAAALGLPESAMALLASAGVACGGLESLGAEGPGVVLVGDMPDDDAAWNALLGRIEEGATAVFLNSGAFKKGDAPTARLPFANKGGLTEFSDWLYHKECVAKAHPIFAGLQPQGVMDWEYYGPVISHRFFEGIDAPEETPAAAFALCHSSRPDGYASGVMIGVQPFGQGHIVLNTFNILENIGQHPAADRLLLNMAAYGTQ